MEKEPRIIMTKEDVQNALRKMAQQILIENSPVKDLALVGIRSKGVELARRLIRLIHDLSGVQLPIGAVDATLYRDDLDNSAYKPVLKKTEIDFPVTDKDIVLVDDVLYTGRTIRAALDALIDLGRPKTIKLAVLIDRGHRELPISANYIGLTVGTSLDESVKVTLEETGEEDGAFILPFPEETRW
ncbi:MAG: bifunctional pyr operon transcriptional regulator/uracil phosphoribosyltransferase PyrR [bacterium]